MTAKGGLGFLSEREFKQLSEFISSECGVKIPPSKRTMLEARLQKRFRALGMQSKQYCQYLFSREGIEQEVPLLFDAVTTNTTHFFRESKHFEYLFHTLLPEWVRKEGTALDFKIWSAGCSTGEEPYTLAMVLAEFSLKTPGFTFLILATDINNQVLEKASRGVYEEEKVKDIPMDLKRKYLLRSKDKSKKLVRVVAPLRSRVKFRRLNFLEDFGFREPMDVIFCRNVMIYFERPLQQTLVQRFTSHLKPAGHIFVGHSESLAGVSPGLQQVAPTVYRKI